MTKAESPRRRGTRKDDDLEVAGVRPAMFGQALPPEPFKNPLELLVEIAEEARTWQRVMRGLVARLDEPDYVDALGVEQVKARVLLYERALDRVGLMLDRVARLNLDERLAVVEQRKAEMFLSALDLALAAIGVSGSEAVMFKHAVAARLRVIDSAAELVPEPTAEKAPLAPLIALQDGRQVPIAVRPTDSLQAATGATEAAPSTSDDDLDDEELLS
jgi:hypothetical protein